MKKKFFSWVSLHLFNQDPNVSVFLESIAKKHFYRGKNYAPLIQQLTDEELSELQNVLNVSLSEFSVKRNGVRTKDARASKLLFFVDEEINKRQAEFKKSKYAALDWDNLIIDEKSFRLSCAKTEFGSWGKLKVDVSRYQEHGFPSHILSYSLYVTLGDEEVLLDNEWKECIMYVYTNYLETEWLKSVRQLPLFSGCPDTDPVPLFLDAYGQQKLDKHRSLPEDTKLRIKKFLCGEKCNPITSGEYQNPDLIKPIVEVLVYNAILERKLFMDKEYVARRIQSEHLKEKMHYRIFKLYPKLRLKKK